MAGLLTIFGIRKDEAEIKINRMVANKEREQMQKAVAQLNSKMNDLRKLQANGVQLQATISGLQSSHDDYVKQKAQRTADTIYLTPLKVCTRNVVCFGNH